MHANHAAPPLNSPSHFLCIPPHPPPSPAFPACRAQPAPAGGAPLLCVNFDPELDKLLREVHDFLQMPSLPHAIPEPALALYERSELFRQQISTLELVAEMHNTIIATILPVESGLLLKQLQDAEACLRRGIEVGCCRRAAAAAAAATPTC